MSRPRECQIVESRDPGGKDWWLIWRGDELLARHRSREAAEAWIAALELRHG